MAARRQARQTQARRVNDQEDQMRAIDCPCGHHFKAADDEELFRLCREHVDADHPEMQRSDAQIRERVAADAYAVETVA
jgi:predicted small metal-binding protein